MHYQNIGTRDAESQKDRASLLALVKENRSILIIAIIRFYQILLAPLWPSRCRFYPTCSNYSIQALQEKGFIKGIWLTVTRILRCNPAFPGGYDPVR